MIKIFVSNLKNTKIFKTKFVLTEEYSKGITNYIISVVKHKCILEDHEEEILKAYNILVKKTYFGDDKSIYVKSLGNLMMCDFMKAMTFSTSLIGFYGFYFDVVVISILPGIFYMAVKSEIYDCDDFCKDYGYLSKHELFLRITKRIHTDYKIDVKKFIPESTHEHFLD